MSDQELNSRAANAPPFPPFITALAIATAVVAGVLGLGLVFPPGVAVLAVGALVLLAAILAFWNSVRTLTGELELPGELEFASMKGGDLRSLEERKRAVLRALKDIEAERAIGKIDDEDFEVLQAKYREEAKDIFRQLDATVEPHRARAEALVAAHLASVGLVSSASAPEADTAHTSADSEAELATKATPKAVVKATSDDHDSDSRLRAETPANAAELLRESTTDAVVGADSKNDRKTCTQCGTSNEIDAKFCKSCSTSLANEAVV